MPAARAGHSALGLGNDGEVWAAGTGDHGEGRGEQPLVGVGSLLVFGGQAVSARYLTLGTRETYHADAWLAELLLPLAVASGGEVDAVAPEAAGASPTPSHAVGAQLRVRWVAAEATAAADNPSSVEEAVGGAGAADAGPDTDDQSAQEAGPAAPAARANHAMAECGAGLESGELSLVLIGGLGDGGTLADHGWRAICRHPCAGRAEPSALRQARAAARLRATQQVESTAEDPAGDFLKRLAREDFFGSEGGTAADGVEAGAELENTRSSSSLEGWPSLSPPPEQTSASGGLSAERQAEALVQLCATLRDRVAAAQQSEARHRAQAAALEDQVRQTREEAEVAAMRSAQLVDAAEVLFTLHTREQSLLPGSRAAAACLSGQGAVGRATADRRACAATVQPIRAHRCAGPAAVGDRAPTVRGQDAQACRG